MLLSLLVGALGFIFFFVGHIFYFLFFTSTNRAKVIINFLFASLLIQAFSIFILFSLTTPISLFYLQGSIWLGGLWCILTFLSLFVLYMPFYYTITASLSVQSLILISDAQNCKVAISKLRDNFISKDLVKQRLYTMVANNYLVSEDERFFLTKKGRFVAQIFNEIKQLWKLGPGG